VTAAELSSLRVGEVIDAGPLFPGMSGEPMLATVNRSLADGVLFKVTYFGVKVLYAKAEFSKGGVVRWTVM
jgi:hypothetical protein